MKLLVTAGPTREPIDPVRYLSNRSSGRMGYAIAEAAVSRDHEVVLITGPVNLDPPANCEIISVETAREMYQAVQSNILSCDAAILCAAVADYRVAEVAPEKIKKHSDTLTLRLEKTDDILGSCRSAFGFRGILVGFAAETENLESNARRKLEKKDCDLLMANDVSRKDIGFDSRENEALLLSRDGETKKLPRQDKRQLGNLLIETVEKKLIDRVETR